METVGEYLRLKREEAGLSKYDVAGTTRINPDFIDSIEKDDFSSFSSLQTLKGYINLIARTSGADPVYALNLLKSQMNGNLKLKKVDDIVGNVMKEEKIKSKRFKGIVIAIISVGIFLLILLFFTIKINKSLKQTQPVPAIPPKKTKTPVIKDSGKVKSKPVKKLNAVIYKAILSARVTKKTWIAVKIDDGLEKVIMLYPGDFKTWKAKRDIHIKIGNAGGVILSYNGKIIGRPGINRQVISMDFPGRARQASGTSN